MFSQKGLMKNKEKAVMESWKGWQKKKKKGRKEGFWREGFGEEDKTPLKLQENSLLGSFKTPPNNRKTKPKQTRKHNRKTRPNTQHKNYKNIKTHKTHKTHTHTHKHTHTQTPHNQPPQPKRATKHQNINKKLFCQLNKVFSAEHCFCGSQTVKGLLETPSKNTLSQENTWIFSFLLCLLKPYFCSVFWLKTWRRIIFPNR